VPTFERHDRPDLQWRIVQLYFMLGWGYETIAVRYGLAHQRVAQILKTWKRRAIETGYIQHIPPFEPFPVSTANTSVQADLSRLFRPVPTADLVVSANSIR